jgi:hypothetical protein
VLKFVSKKEQRMRIFVSGELDEKISHDFRQLFREADELLKPLESKDYGTEFESIGIIPIIIDPKRGLFEAGFFKERKYIKRKLKGADIRLRTDFDKFYAADYSKKRLLFLDNIIRSIRVIGEKSKSDFNSEKLITDILEAFKIDENTLNQEVIS